MPQYSLGFIRVIVNNPPIKVGFLDMELIPGNVIVVCDRGMFAIDKPTLDGIKDIAGEIMGKDNVLYSEGEGRDGAFLYYPFGKFERIGHFKTPYSRAKLTEMFQEWEKNGYEPKWV